MLTEKNVVFGHGKKGQQRNIKTYEIIHIKYDQFVGCQLCLYRTVLVFLKGKKSEIY